MTSLACTASAPNAVDLVDNANSFGKFGSRKNSLHLLQSLDLFVPRSLPDLEILQNKVTCFVQVGSFGGELVQLEHYILFILVCLGQVVLGLCLLVGLVDNVLALLFYR